jgi:hypothetical protein
MTSEKIIRDVIDSMCLPCAKRMLHFQLFTMTSSTQSSKYYWIVEMLNEKKKRETDSEPLGCGICFGLLEKYSQKPYLTQVILIKIIIIIIIIKRFLLFLKISWLNKLIIVVFNFVISEFH